MTGIERLRRLAGLFTNPTMKNMLGNELNDIADQIEREQEAIVRETEDVAGRDGDALAWVEEHGGLEAVKVHWSGRVALSHVNNMAERHKAKVARMQRHIEHVQGVCKTRAHRIVELSKLNRSYVYALNGVCEHLGLTDGTGLPDMPEVIWTELDRRLMPEGMEWLLEVWPKWSNGEYCKFGEWWVSDNYGEPKPKQFRKLSIYTPEQLDEWGQGDGESYGYEWDFVRPSDPKYRPDKAEPPAPKVLDADGVEIRVGDKLYDTETGCGRTVRAINADGTIEFDGHDDRGWFANRLTHRAPVLAADGKPLREGETVYHVNTGTEYSVRSVTNGGAHLSKGDKPGGYCRADYLTHERPDSFEQLEKDANDLIYDIGFHLGDYSPSDFKEKGDSVQDRVRDLVLRAKALAERDA